MINNISDFSLFIKDLTKPLANAGNALFFRGHIVPISKTLGENLAGYYLLHLVKETAEMLYKATSKKCTCKTERKCISAYVYMI